MQSRTFFKLIFKEICILSQNLCLLSLVPCNVSKLLDFWLPGWSSFFFSNIPEWLGIFLEIIIFASYVYDYWTEKMVQITWAGLIRKKCLRHSFSRLNLTRYSTLETLVPNSLFFYILGPMKIEQLSHVIYNFEISDWQNWSMITLYK